MRGVVIIICCGFLLSWFLVFHFSEGLQLCAAAVVDIIEPTSQFGVKGLDGAS